MILEKIYSLLPYPLQNLACFLRSIEQRKARYGGIFKEKLRWLEDSQWWDFKTIEEYQLKELKRILSWSYKNVPYYHKILCKEDILPDQINSLTDLKKIPILSKEALLENFTDLQASNFYAKKKLFKSGGTTGKSVKFYQEKDAIQFRWAVWWRHRLRFGIGFDSSYATFTGLAAVPLDCQNPPFWRENRLMHQTIFNMHHIVPQKIGHIVKRLNHGVFVYYSGYPSILYHLACLIEAEGLSIQNPPQIIFTGAEILTSLQKKFIEKIFHAPVTDLYGFSEGAGNASKCECGVYHEDFEFGILECQNPEPLGDKRYRGEILATGFACMAMPLIRYKVGDVGIWEDRECECGRKSKVLLSIEGRSEDYVVLPDGARIRRFDYIFKDSSNVIEAQVVQERLGTVKIKLVRRDSYTKLDEIDLRKQIFNKISRNLEVEFEYVSQIPRESNGKFRAVKSLLKAEQI